jgi:lipoprotein-anchoring transpeptidase ErfK/SrfK
MTPEKHRRASIVLGIAASVIALLGVVTGVNDSSGHAILAGPPPPPPIPAPVVTVTAGSTAIPVAVSAPAASKPGAPAPAAAAVTPGVPINPTTPVAVSVTQGTLRSVTLTDARSGKTVPGTLGPDGHSWHSGARLAYGGTYKLTASAVDEDQKPAASTATVTTLAPAKLDFASFIPAPSSSSVGVGQPLVVRFNHPVSDKVAAERALTVTSVPAQQGAWFWMSSTEAHYRPPSYWQPGSTITLAANMFGVDLGNKTFGESDRSETIHIHDAWVAKADGSSEQMQIFHNGALVKTMPISLGEPKNPSHNGPHVISDKQPSIIMDSCTYGVCQGQKGYYKEKVDLDERISADGEFVHSAPWSVGQQGDTNVSHGCVNLSPANAQWFFTTFGVGDVVEIAHSGGPTLPVWDTYGDWVLSWAQWQAGGASG